MHHDLQPGYEYWKRHQIKDSFWPLRKGPYQTSTTEWTATPISDTWLRLRPALPDQDENITWEVDSWPKMPEQVCILITLTIAHTFANEPNVFLGLNHMQVSKKSIQLLGLWPITSTPRLPWWISPLQSSNWMVLRNFISNETLAPCKLTLPPISLRDTLLPGQLMAHVLNLAIILLFY